MIKKLKTFGTASYVIMSLINFQCHPGFKAVSKSYKRLKIIWFIFAKKLPHPYFNLSNREKYIEIHS